MRRDLCYYYDCPLNLVFNAFVQAANQKFGKDCKIDQGKTITFGLNYSFKYNMNGGAVTAHFMPYQNGTAVDLRYSIVQLMGARYKAHARDLTLYVNDILQTAGTLIQLDINEFLNYEQTASPVPAQAPAQQYIQPPAAPQQFAVPQQPAAASAQAVCPNCGKAAPSNARFCAGCGHKLQCGNVCSQCGTPVEDGARFCTVCGNKIG